MELFEIHSRNGLPHFCGRLKRREPIHISYVGGSVSHLRGWRERTFRWLQDNYPEIQFVEHDKTVGGQSALLANHNWSNHVLTDRAHLIVADFSVNGVHDKEALRYAVEQIIRTTWAHDESIEFLFVHFTTRHHLVAALEGMCFPTVVAIEEVLEHYNVPSINLLSHIVDLYKRDKLVYDHQHAKELRAILGPDANRGRIIFSADGIHPIYGSGDLVYRDIFANAFPQILQASTTPNTSFVLPEPLEKRQAEVTFNELFAGFADDIFEITNISGTKGTIPSLQRKVRLRNFSVSGNYLRGAIPQLSDCPEMKVFSCFENYLSGELPDISANKKLKSFNCGRNNLSGPLPPTSHNPSLTKTSVRNNKFSGLLPDLDSNSELERYDILGNRLSGSLPNLAHTPKLQRLRCACNKLTGVFPDLSTCTDLALLDCGDNHFSGPFPNISTNEKLHTVRFENNHFTGQLPDISALNELVVFKCENNSLTGHLPALKRDLSIKELTCGNNSLEGTLEILLHLPQLNIFDCENNLLNGTLPQLSLNQELAVFNCSNNLLSGSLDDIALPSSLQDFNCERNLLTGSIPDFRHLRLRSFQASGNFLSNYIPGSLKQDTLEQIDLSWNNLTAQQLDIILGDLVASLELNNRPHCSVILTRNDLYSRTAHDQVATLLAHGWKVIL